jgi:hypothetical protein
MIVLIVERKNKLKKFPRPGFSVGASTEHPSPRKPKMMPQRKTQRTSSQRENILHWLGAELARTQDPNFTKQKKTQPTRVWQ